MADKQTLLKLFAFCIAVILIAAGGYLLWTKIGPGSRSRQTASILEDGDSSTLGTETTSQDPVEVELTPTKDLSAAGWIANWATADGFDSYKSSAVITSVSPTWYYVNPDGSLGLKSGARSDQSIETVHQNGHTIIPSISNSSAGQLSIILKTQSQRKFLIQKILEEVEKYGYDGIDIDFEEIKADDKSNFSLFIKELSTELHSRDKLLTIAVLAKTDEFIYSLSEPRLAQDWKEIGKFVDEFRIMGYDFEHNGTTAAGPVSSVTWLEEILKYAVAQVSREKIMLGLPLYGYRWTLGSKTTSFTWQTEQSWEREWGVKGKLDPESKEKTLKYGNTQLWYQDAESIKYRLDLAKEYNIKGVVFWRLGREDSNIWKNF